ncbi:MAG: hypothetical protein LBR22_03330 [Desulfovibrio sp.]|jgi:hypothetical protein|nr:hypothetical protein [Desulfovibrio sp.]
MAKARLTPFMKKLAFNMGKTLAEEMAKTETYSEYYADGFAKGYAEIKAKEIQNGLLRILNIRYPSVSASLVAKIRSITEPGSLYCLLDATQEHNDLAAFERTVENTLHEAIAR